MTLGKGEKTTPGRAVDVGLDEAMNQPGRIIMWAAGHSPWLTRVVEDGHGQRSSYPKDRMIALALSLLR